MCRMHASAGGAIHVVGPAQAAGCSFPCTACARPRGSHRRVRLREALAGEGDDLRITRVVRRLDPDDRAADVRVVELKMVDELILGDAGAEDEQGALRRQPPCDVAEESLLVVPRTRCVRVDVLPRLLTVMDVLMDVLAGELEYLGDLTVDPDDGVMHGENDKSDARREQPPVA